MSKSQSGKDERKKPKKSSKSDKKEKPSTDEYLRVVQRADFPSQSEKVEIGNPKFPRPQIQGKNSHMDFVALKSRPASSRTAMKPTTTFHQYWHCSFSCYQAAMKRGTEPPKSGITAPICQHHVPTDGRRWRSFSKPRWPRDLKQEKGTKRNHQ